MKNGFRILCELLMVTVMAALASQRLPAAVLAQYQFNSNLNTSDTNPDSLATSLTLGSNITGAGYDSGGNGGTTPPALKIPKSAIDSNTKAASISTGTEYLQFTVTATAGGMVLQLNGGTVTAQFEGQGANRSFWVLRSSLDNYATDIGSDQACLRNPNFANNSVTLSGTQFGNLNTITFRMYLWQTQNDDIRFDNITLNGSLSLVPVPEVGTMWVSLVVIGAVIAGTQFRRVQNGRLL